MPHGNELATCWSNPNIISEEQLEDALNNKNREEKIGDYLIKQKLITEQQLIQVLEMQLGIPRIHLSQQTIDPELTHIVPKELAKRANIMPVRKNGNKLLIAMGDPMDYFIIEEVRMATGYQIETSIAAKDDIFRAITKYYDLQESMDEVIHDNMPTDLGR